jgi:hypothetical protein
MHVLNAACADPVRSDSAIQALLRHVSSSYATNATTSENVDPLEKRGLDGEEVAGKRACGLRAQKRTPRLMAPLRRRRRPRGVQKLGSRFVRCFGWWLATFALS